MLTAAGRRTARLLVEREGMTLPEAFFAAKQRERGGPEWDRLLARLGLTERTFDPPARRAALRELT